MRNLRLLSAAVLGASLLTASAAQATTVSYDFTYGPEGVPQTSHLLGDLPLFNTALGTLTEVDLTLAATTDSGTITWENLSEVPTDVTLGVGATVTATAVPGGLAATAIPLQTGSGSTTAFDGDEDFAGPDTFAVTGGSGTDSNTDVLTGAGVTNYEGSGNFDVNGVSTLSTEVLLDGGSGHDEDTDGETSGTVTVTYTYSPVPEPGSLALLGLAGLGTLIRRRRAMNAI